MDHNIKISKDDLTTEAIQEPFTHTHYHDILVKSIISSFLKLTDCIDVTFYRFATLFASDISLTHVPKEINMDYGFEYDWTPGQNKMVDYISSSS